MIAINLESVFIVIRVINLVAGAGDAQDILRLAGNDDMISPAILVAVIRLVQVIGNDDTAAARVVRKEIGRVVIPAFFRVVVLTFGHAVVLAFGRAVVLAFGRVVFLAFGREVILVFGRNRDIIIGMNVNLDPDYVMVRAIEAVDRVTDQEHQSRCPLIVHLWIGPRNLLLRLLRLPLSLTL